MCRVRQYSAGLSDAQLASEQCSVHSVLGLLLVPVVAMCGHKAKLVPAQAASIARERSAAEQRLSQRAVGSVAHDLALRPQYC